MHCGLYGSIKKAQIEQEETKQKENEKHVVIGIISRGAQRTTLNEFLKNENENQ